MQTEPLDNLTFFLTRKEQLKSFRTNCGIEDIWRQADADYVPHKLGVFGKKVLVENERTQTSTYVNLQKNKWRSAEAKNDPYIKIQTAMSILFDRNPEATFDPGSSRFETNTILIERLYHRTWTDTNINARPQLRKFIFNCAKYGWCVARRYYKKEVRKGMQMVKEYDIKTQEFTYEKKDIVDVDDVYFENKSVWDAWIDDMSMPDDPRSTRDWMWREIMDKASFEMLLDEVNFTGDKGQFQFGTVTKEEAEHYNSQKNNRQYTSDDLIEVFFYENRIKDIFFIEAGGKKVADMHLPRTDKELSLIQTYWTIRSDVDPYGIGINEIMRSNKVLKDKIRNMTIDQVVLSIYKMFFYSNSEQLDDEGGEMVSLEPGKGKKVIDPKNITWSDIPGPGRDAMTMIDMLDKDMEDDTGVTKTLEGEITGKTAFEISQAQQGALKRLSNPLRSIKQALEWDAKLTVNLMQLVYSVPKVKTIVDPDLIAEYVASVNADPSRYFIDPETGALNATKYREFQLSLEESQEGGFQPSEEKRFFMIKPPQLAWEGQITIRVESMFETSRPLEQRKKLEMSNMLVPLLQTMGANPAMVPVLQKPAKQILKIYDENPKSWMPDAWLIDVPLVPAIPQGPIPPDIQGVQQAETVVPPTDIQIPAGAQGEIQSASQQL